MAVYNVSLKVNTWANGQLVFNQNSSTGTYTMDANGVGYPATNITVTSGANPKLATFNVSVAPRYTLNCVTNYDGSMTVGVTQPVGPSPAADTWTESQQGSGANYDIAFGSNTWADGSLNTNNGNYNPSSSAVGANVPVTGLATGGNGAPTAFVLPLCNPGATQYQLTFTGGPGTPTNPAPVTLSNPASLVPTTTASDSWDASAGPVPPDQGHNGHKE